MDGGRAMGNGPHIGRGALAFALLVVMGPAVLAPASTVSPAVRLSADSTALIMGGTSIPTWNDADVEVIMNQFIAPTHPGQTIEPVAVTTPNEFWPFTGLIRLACLALCDPPISRMRWPTTETTIW
jgi:hypothetical protein